MRHFLVRELAPEAIAVPGLSHRLQASSPGLHPINGRRAAQRLVPAYWPTGRAETLAPIAAAADAKLNATPLAEGEPVLLGRHEAPCRRFLDTEPEP
jgi:hypothetical protein